MSSIKLVLYDVQQILRSLNSKIRPEAVRQNILEHARIYEPVNRKRYVQELSHDITAGLCNR
jgi:hypothetical protein